jgi:hypothetical protein
MYMNLQATLFVGETKQNEQKMGNGGSRSEM